MSEELVKKAKEYRKAGNFAKSATIFRAAAEKTDSIQEKASYFEEAINAAKDAEKYDLALDYIQTIIKISEEGGVSSEGFLVSGINLLQNHIIPKISVKEQLAEMYSLLSDFALKAEHPSTNDILYQAGKAWKIAGKETLEDTSLLGGRGKTRSEAGIKALSKAIEYFQRLQLPDEVVDTLIEGAGGFIHRQEDQRAMTLFQQAIMVPNSNKERTAKLIGQKLTEKAQEILSKTRRKEEITKRGDFFFEQAYDVFLKGNATENALESALKHLKYTLDRPERAFQLFDKVVQQAQDSNLPSYVQTVGLIAMKHGEGLLLQQLQSKKATESFKMNPGTLFLDKADQYARSINDTQILSQIASIYVKFAQELYSRFDIIGEVFNILETAEKTIFETKSDVSKSIVELSTKVGCDQIKKGDFPASESFLTLSRKILEQEENTLELALFYSEVLISLISVKNWDLATETTSNLISNFQKSQPERAKTLFESLHTKSHEFFAKNDLKNSLNTILILIKIMEGLNRVLDAAEIIVQEGKRFGTKDRKLALQLLDRATKVYNQQEKYLDLANTLMISGEVLLELWDVEKTAELRVRIQKYFQAAQKAYSTALKELIAEQSDKTLAIETVDQNLSKTKNLIIKSFYEIANLFALDGLDKLNNWDAKDLAVKHALILGKEYVNQNQYEKGKNLLFQSITFQKEMQTGLEDLGDFISEVANIITFKTDYGTALDLYEEAITILKNENPEKAQSIIEGTLEFSRSLRPTDIQSSRLFFMKSIDYLRLLGKNDQIVELFIQNGQNFFESNEFTESIDNFQKAFDVLFEFNNVDKIVELAETCIELSEEAINKNYLEEAPKYRTLAFTNCKRGNLEETEGDLYYLIAKRSFQNLRLKDSRAALVEADQCYFKVNPSKALALANEIAKEGLGIIEKAINDPSLYSHGLGLFDIAVESLSRREDKSRAIDILYELGSLLIQNSRYLEAMSRFRRALLIYSETKQNETRIREIGDKLVNYAKKLTEEGNHETADRLFDQSRVVYEQLPTTATSKKTSEIQQEYTDTLLDEIFNLELGGKKQKRRRRKPKN
ncbi:MAG: hypothetical protein ACFFCZ_15890 [Promethearchaeota archaeon]